MELEEMKLKDILELTRALKGNKSDDSFFEVNKCYLIRTVTLYYTGRLKKVNSRELLLEDAAWVADTGRFNECLTNGKFNEVEPFTDDVIVPRDAVIDATIFKHPLPRTVK